MKTFIEVKCEDRLPPINPKFTSHRISNNVVTVFTGLNGERFGVDYYDYDNERWSVQSHLVISWLEEIT